MSKNNQPQNDEDLYKDLPLMAYRDQTSPAEGGAKNAAPENDPPKKSRRARKAAEPATKIMKTVAAKTDNVKSLDKIFTDEEVKEILARRDAGDPLTRAEHRAIQEKYRKLKRRAKEMEQGNKSKLIAIPSLVGQGGFYKMFDFSALYYVYRLAARMDRTANLMGDSDRFSKMLHATSVVNMDKFVDQFKLFDGGTAEKTEEGMYIFTLKRELTDEELSELRLVEETRRKMVYDMLKPKSMNPAVFTAILQVVRMVGPRARKLERHEYYAIGEKMVVDLRDLLWWYFCYAKGLTDKKTAGQRIMETIESLCAGLSVLYELRVWDYPAVPRMGDSINEVRRLAAKEFGYKEY